MASRSTRLLVQVDPPIIDLDGYQRLTPVEREIARSPAAIASYFGAAAGLLMVALGGTLLSGFITFPDWDAKAVGGTITLAGCLVCVAAVGLGRAWELRRLARLKCPHCG